MKSWLKKFQISAALDETRSSERATEPPVAQPDELGQFAAALHHLDHQLKNARPADAAPDDLHAAIMRRVRNAARDQENRPTRRVINWRWLTAPGLAVLVGLGLWLAMPEKKSATPALVSSESARSLAAAAATLEMTRAVVQNAPAAALAPMEKEITLLRSDARRAMDLVFASLPQDAIAFARSGENRPPY